jgi:urease accessory protein
MRPDFAHGNANPLNNNIPQASGWEAQLKLGFALRGEKTVLTRRQHSGPLTVQRAFYPEGNLCHIYLLHPPGGVVAGDRLAIDIEVDNGAQALITTPAAGKFYRSAGPEAKQTVHLSVAPKATLEWLPQETIVFQGAKLVSTMQIELAKDAGFIGWEVLALGRPAAGEGFTSGHIVLNWRITRAERLIYLERLQLDAAAFAARWGLNGLSAGGTLFAYPASAQQLAAVQELIDNHPERGVTRIDDLLICRGLDSRADRLRDFFQQVWQLIRTDIIQRPVCVPRIWAT